MFVEHRNKEKMSCKPPSGHHLKGYTIIVIRVLMGLLIKKKIDKQPVGTPHVDKSICCLSSEFTSLPLQYLCPLPCIYVSTTWVGNAPNMYRPEGIVQLPGWTTSLLPPLPWHRELLGELLPVQPSRGQVVQCDGPRYNNIGLCFVKSHFRALYRPKGNLGSDTRSVPISWDDCRHFQCSCSELLSAGTPGRGSPAASHKPDLVLLPSPAPSGSVSAAVQPEPPPMNCPLVPAWATCQPHNAGPGCTSKRGRAGWESFLLHNKG